MTPNPKQQLVTTPTFHHSNNLAHCSQTAVTVVVAMKGTTMKGTSDGTIKDSSDGTMRGGIGDGTRVYSVSDDSTAVKRLEPLALC